MSSSKDKREARLKKILASRPGADERRQPPVSMPSEYRHRKLSVMSKNDQEDMSMTANLDRAMKKYVQLNTHSQVCYSSVAKTNFDEHIKDENCKLWKTYERVIRKVQQILTTNTQQTIHKIK